MPDDGVHSSAGATTIALKDGATKVRGDGATVEEDVVAIITGGTTVVDARTPAGAKGYSVGGTTDGLTSAGTATGGVGVRGRGLGGRPR